MEYQKLKQSEKKRKAKEIIEEYKQTNTTQTYNDADLDLSTSVFMNNRIMDGKPVYEAQKRIIKFGG